MPIAELLLDDARRLAASIIRTMRPYCYRNRILAAGSVRRRIPMVHDIDIVCIPKDRQAFMRRAGRRSTIVLDGHWNVQLITRAGIQIDFFFAKPEERNLFGIVPSNWGSVLLCRTGSAQHNARLALAAKISGMHWNPYEGLVSPSGVVLASETEESIFATLGWPYVRPESRN